MCYGFSTWINMVQCSRHRTENGQQTQEESQDYDMTFFSSTNDIQSLPIQGFESAFKLQFNSCLPQWCWLTCEYILFYSSPLTLNSWTRLAIHVSRQWDRTEMDQSKDGFLLYQRWNCGFCIYHSFFCFFCFACVLRILRFDFSIPYQTMSQL